MKRLNNTILTWSMIISFLTLLFFLYNKQENNDYLRVENDASPPSELHPEVERNKKLLIEKAADIGIDVVITEELRTFDDQEALFAMGRSVEGNKVTNARGGESYHNYGLAIDYALRDNNGKIIWDMGYDGNGNGEPDWIEVADIGKELGFDWGGDWKHFRDYPHLQMTFGLSISDLQNGLRPAIDAESADGD